MRSDPQISIIVPFLNAEKFLDEAIRSALAQTYNSWELLLVDDGSTDGSTDLARSYAEQYPGRIRYLEHSNHSNRGISATRNLGLRQAQGEFVALLDADDVWLPQKLEQQAAILSKNPAAAMVYGHSFYWSSWTNRVDDAARDRTPDLRVPLDTVIPPPDLLVKFVTRASRTPCPSDVMVRRAAAERVEGFEDSFTGMYEDQVFFAKICLQFPVFTSSQTWDRYRVHPDSCYAQAKATNQRATARGKYLHWLAEYLAKAGIDNAELRTALRRQLWPYRHPIISRVTTGARQLKSQLARFTGAN